MLLLTGCLSSVQCSIQLVFSAMRPVVTIANYLVFYFLVTGKSALENLSGSRHMHIPFEPISSAILRLSSLGGHLTRTSYVDIRYIRHLPCYYPIFTAQTPPFTLLFIYALTFFFDCTAIRILVSASVSLVLCGFRHVSLVPYLVFLRSG